MRIGVMGGTFDPIHIGHLICAEEARIQHSLDRIIFMVAGRPAFKESSSIADAQDRYWMCCLATADNPHFEVSTLEIDRIGTTYTIDTLRDLHEQLDDEDIFDAQLYFIMGTDALIDVPQWKDAHKVGDYAQFLVAHRPGYDFAEARALVARRLPHFKYASFSLPRMDISSSDIRTRMAKGLSNRYLMPEEVEHYALQRELYH